VTRVADRKIDIQTLPWPEIVRLIGEIRKHNPITSLSNNPNLGDMVGEDVDVNIKKLDAHDVAKYVPLLFLLPINVPASAHASKSVANGITGQYSIRVDADSQPYITPGKLPNRIIQQRPLRPPIPIPLTPLHRTPHPYQIHRTINRPTNTLARKTIPYPRWRYIDEIPRMELKVLPHGILI